MEWWIAVDRIGHANFFVVRLLAIIFSHCRARAER
jgi:hypothetical protein